MRLRQLLLIIFTLMIAIGICIWLWNHRATIMTDGVATVAWHKGNTDISSEKKVITRRLAELGFYTPDKVTIIDMPTPEQLQKADVIVVGPDASSLVQFDIPPQKPIVMMAPDGLPKTSSKNISSVIYDISAERYVEMINAFMPEVQTIGLVRRSDDMSGGKYAASLKDQAELNGISVFEVILTDHEDVQKVISPLMDQVDALICLSMNNDLPLFQKVLDLTHKDKIPVFADHTNLVKNGAIAAMAYDLDLIGQNVGDLIVAAIKQGVPQNIVLDVEKAKTYINSKQLLRCEITIPEELKDSVVDVSTNETSKNEKEKA